MVLRRWREPDPLDHVKPDEVPPRWRGAVEEALTHRERYRSVLEQVRDGPARDRVEGLADRVDAGVLAVWEVVQRGTVAEQTLGAVDLPRATGELKAARRELASAREAGHEDPGLVARVDALADRHAAAHRLRNLVDDLEGRVRLLDARLGAVVVHAAELAAGTALGGSLEEAASELDAAVDDLSATRQALDELGL